MQETKDEADDAWADVSQYLSDNPEASDAKNEPGLALELERYRAVAERADTRHEQALDARDSAQLTSATAKTVVQQRLQTVDEPEIPVAAQPARWACSCRSRWS